MGRQDEGICEGRKSVFAGSKDAKGVPALLFLEKQYDT